jgi:hypothetical protein
MRRPATSSSRPTFAIHVTANTTIFRSVFLHLRSNFYVLTVAWF